MTLLDEPSAGGRADEPTPHEPTSEHPAKARADAATVLAIFAVLLIALPSKLVFAQLGSRASPALLLGVVLLMWWLVGRLVPSVGVDRRFQPVRIVLALLVVACLAAYAAGFLDGLSGAAGRAADRGLLYGSGLAGIALVAMDGVSSRRRLDLVLRALVFITAVSAAIAVIWFAWGIDLVGDLRIPGLSANGPLTFVGTRGGIRRVTGTAQHPLEFGLIMALVLPLSLHCALFAPSRKWVWWGCVGLIGAAIPMSLGRAAIIGAVTGILMLFVVWPRNWKLTAVLLLPVYLVVIKIGAKGVLGTLQKLFTESSTDASISHRVLNYDRIGSVMRHHWLFGNGGFGSYTPVRFDYILDNAYLTHLFETGLFGVAALALLVWVSLCTARGARLRSADPTARHLAQALAASVAAAIPGLFTFDVFAYSMASGVLFLVFGCSGAAWRLSRAEQRDPTTRRSLSGASRSR